MGSFIDYSCLVLFREEEFFSGPSFETISASGLNAAMAHYRYLRRKNFLGLCGGIPEYMRGVWRWRGE